MKRLGYLSLVFLLLGWLPAALPSRVSPVRIVEAQQASVGSRTVTVLVGGGQDTIVLDGFFPQQLRIRVGDTVTWKFNGVPTHRHTVTITGAANAAYNGNWTVANLNAGAKTFEIGPVTLSPSSPASGTITATLSGVTGGPTTSNLINWMRGAAGRRHQAAPSSRGRRSGRSAAVPVRRLSRSPRHRRAIP